MSKLNSCDLKWRNERDLPELLAGWQESLTAMEASTPRRSAPPTIFRCG